MSDSVQPHGRQPTRLPRPWDSPGKNTGVGCHCLLQGMKVKSESEVAQSCPTLSDPMVCSPPGSSIHEIFQARVLMLTHIHLPQFWSNAVFFKFLLATSIYHSSVICNSQQVEISLCRDEGITKCALTYSLKKEGNSDICYNMDEHQKHYTV